MNHSVAQHFDTVSTPSAHEKPASPPKSKLMPMTFRVTDSERAEIKALAGSQSVSEYVRESALRKKSRRKRRVKVVTPSQKNAARILGLLGQSGVLANLASIADAAESGALPVTGELTEELRNACALVIAIRYDLIEALGIKVQS